MTTQKESPLAKGVVSFFAILLLAAAGFGLSLLSEPTPVTSPADRERRVFDMQVAEVRDAIERGEKRHLEASFFAAPDTLRHVAAALVKLGLTFDDSDSFSRAYVESVVRGDTKLSDALQRMQSSYDPERIDSTLASKFWTAFRPSLESDIVNWTPQSPYPRIASHMVRANFESKRLSEMTTLVAATDTFAANIRKVSAQLTILDDAEGSLRLAEGEARRAQRRLDQTRQVRGWIHEQLPDGRYAYSNGPYYPATYILSTAGSGVTFTTTGWFDAVVEHERGGVRGLEYRVVPDDEYVRLVQATLLPMSMREDLAKARSRAAQISDEWEEFRQLALQTGDKILTRGSARVTSVGRETSSATSISDLRQGMPYSEAREIILAAGWQADTVPWQERYWTQHESSIRGREQEMVEDLGYHELQSCAGSGRAQCRFEYSNAERRQLVVITAGESQDPSLDKWWTD